MPELNPYTQFRGNRKAGRRYAAEIRRIPAEYLAGLGEVRDGNPGELEADSGNEPFPIDPNIFNQEKNKVGTKDNPGEFDCYAAAEPDEPMFILLARDPIAPALLHYWANARVSTGRNKTPDEKRKIKEARECAAAMENYYREKIKNGK